ncbi:MAG: 1-acyl-sn-glycerol-3-phosphate acyltransferase, partial [Oscillospiraceae bacterium]|nr:1-acyl-sn-glycerol-3-phosphate acyltransferase [Oscillospiraceae bacterium]
MSSRLKKIANFVFAKSIYRVVEYNKPDLSDDTYILAPNHVSDADGPTIWGINENIRIMAKKECFERKIVGKILTAAGVVSVDRDKKNGTEIRDAIRYLSKDENCLFMMFPQGTISD